VHGDHGPDEQESRTSQGESHDRRRLAAERRPKPAAGARNTNFYRMYGNRF